MSTIKTIGIVAAVVVLGGGAIAFFINKPSSVNVAQNSTSNSQVPSSGNRARPAPSPALTALQTKYEAQLTVLATNKDENGFVKTYIQYQTEAKPILDEQRVARQAANSSNIDTNSSTGSSRVVPTEAEQTANAKAEYTRALGNISGNVPFVLGNQGGRGRNGGQGLNNQQP